MRLFACYEQGDLLCIGEVLSQIRAFHMEALHSNSQYLFLFGVSYLANRCVAKALYILHQASLRFPST